MCLHWFTPYDWSRSYLLPDHVTSSIPLRGSIGMLGAHNQARGLLVETCRYLADAIPVALHYRETVEEGGDIVVSITVTVRRSTGLLLTVDTRTRHRQHADECAGDWTLCIDDVPHPAENRARPPSPPVQGYLVTRLA